MPAAAAMPALKRAAPACREHVVIKIHDSASGRLQALTPDASGHVGIYVCGPTTYEHAHVGHMRSFLTYDVLVRHLREHGVRVTYVRNITDVEDKIIKRAAERGETPEQLSRRYEQAFREDTDAFGLLRPEHEPRVSDNLDQIRDLIARLINKGAAYASDGDVYFSVAAFPAY